MTELEVLDFGDCLLRTEGGKSIARAVKDGHTKLRVSFRSTYLYNNNYRIRDEWL